MCSDDNKSEQTDPYKGLKQYCTSFCWNVRDCRVCLFFFAEVLRIVLDVLWVCEVQHLHCLTVVWRGLYPDMLKDPGTKGSYTIGCHAHSLNQLARFFVCSGSPLPIANVPLGRWLCALRALERLEFDCSETVTCSGLCIYLWHLPMNFLHFLADHLHPENIVFLFV